MVQYFCGQLEEEIIYKQIVAFFILAAFLVQTFSRTFIVIDYYTNTSAYAKNCENKDKPMMHCNGRCQMMKKLNAEDKKDQNNTEHKADYKNEIPLSSKSFFASIGLQAFEHKISAKTSGYLNGKCIDRSFGIFHPPKA